MVQHHQHQPGDSLTRRARGNWRGLRVPPFFFGAAAALRGLVAALVLGACASGALADKARPPAALALRAQAAAAGARLEAVVTAREALSGRLHLQAAQGAGRRFPVHLPAGGRLHITARLAGPGPYRAVLEAAAGGPPFRLVAVARTGPEARRRGPAPWRARAGAREYPAP